jgi:hypothetical protein
MESEPAAELFFGRMDEDDDEARRHRASDLLSRSTATSIVPASELLLTPHAPPVPVEPPAVAAAPAFAATANPVASAVVAPAFRPATPSGPAVAFPVLTMPVPRAVTPPAPPPVPPAVLHAVVPPTPPPASRPAPRAGLPPLATWVSAGSRPTIRHATKGRESGENDLRALMRSLALPPDVAGISYPTGCRIARLRVRRMKTSTSTRKSDGDGHVVILSRKRLQELRAAAARG